MFVLVIITY